MIRAEAGRPEPHRRVLVAGIGNIFLGDDGFGIEVTRRLASQPLPEGVVVADYGIRALHLAFALLDAPDLLVLVDAVSRHQLPGTLFLIESPLDVSAVETADAHGMDLRTLAGMITTLGATLPPTQLIGCEPASLSAEMGLSAPVMAAVPRAVEMVMAAIAR